MNYEAQTNKIYCDCGTLIYDGLFHKSYLVEMVCGEIVCPKCGEVHGYVRGMGQDYD